MDGERRYRTIGAALNGVVLVAQVITARPDSQIDTSDIAEITDWTGAVRGLFARPATRQISIRLCAVER